MAVNFYLDSRPDKNGDLTIRVSISMFGKRLVTSSGHRISESKWNFDKQEVKRGCNNSKGATSIVINSHLKGISSHFADIESKGISDNEKIDLRKEFAVNFRRKKAISQKEKTFFDYFDEFTKEMGCKNDWTEATFQKFASLKKHLENFDSKINFSKLDEKGLDSLIEYFRNVPIGKNTIGMRNSTIGKQIGFLKWFLRWVTSKNYNTEIAFQSYRPNLKSYEKRVVFLEWDELMSVYNAEIPDNKKYLERVRDVFCFCCFTSLRYSDVANLKRSDVFKEYISITTIKTADNLKIDLNDYSKAILSKYKNKSFPHNNALPVISNQRMNEYLKELGKLCNIDKQITITYFKGNKRYDEVYSKYELLGTHTGRRTFICNALILGIAPQIVMKWTGHSDYKAMKPYIDIADNAKSEAMTLFNKK